MWSILAIASCLLNAPLNEHLDGPQVHGTLGGGHIDSLRVDPRNPDRLAATFRSQAFIRTGPGRWQPAADPQAVRFWPLAQSAGTFRLPNGELVHRTAELGPTLIVGATDSGMVESERRFSEKAAPTPLPITAVLSAAPDPSGSGQVLAAGDPAGLYLCPGGGAPCALEAPGRFTVVAWFGDGTRLAGDAKGGLWRYNEGGWSRQQLAEPAIDITGVVDGGPRYLQTAREAWLVSQDHGRSWSPSDPPAGRLGSGGMIARRTVTGQLEVTDLLGKKTLYGEEGAVPEGCPIRWASPEVVVVGLADGVLAIERGGSMRRIQYEDGQKRPFFHAWTQGDTLHILAGRNTLQRFTARARAQWTAERFWDGAVSGLWWIIGLMAALGLMVTLINRKAASMTRP